MQKRPQESSGEGNRADAWCVYLTGQMHEKYGFQKDKARHMVSRWLKSIKSVRTSQGRDAGKGNASYQVPIQTKEASSKA